MTAVQGRYGDGAAFPEMNHHHLTHPNRDV